jgi:hypothetical protein
MQREQCLSVQYLTSKWRLNMTKKNDEAKSVVPIHSYYVNLTKEIDDADWLGNYNHADFLRIEEEYIKKEIDSGALWYPLF